MNKIVNPAPGYVRNPAKNYTRNLKCICQSGKKIKNCCGKEDYVTIHDAKVFNDMIKFVNEQYSKYLEDNAKKA